MSENIEAQEEMKELTLQSILENIDGINSKHEDKEIVIEHKRLNASFKFFIPKVADLAKVGDKSKGMNVPEVYKALSLNLLTKIDDEMLKALKVATQLDALKRLFTEDEIIIVLASLMDGIDEDGITVKKP